MEVQDSRISELKRDDIVSLHYGFDRLIAKVLGNNGAFITWHSLGWLESSAENFSYKQCEVAEITKIGTYRNFWERILSFNLSKINYIT